MIQPLYGKIIVEQRPPEAQTEGGIITPNEQASAYADVVAVGDGTFNSDGSVRAMIVKEGDVVYINTAYNYSPFKYKGKEYMQLNETDIIGIVPQEEAPKKVVAPKD